MKLARQIIELTRMKLLGLKIKNSLQVKKTAVIWDLELKDGGFCLISKYDDKT